MRHEIIVVGVGVRLGLGYQCVHIVHWLAARLLNRDLITWLNRHLVAWTGFDRVSCRVARA
jgi:hypothetical protein